jgi:hypothetical protein
MAHELGHIFTDANHYGVDYATGSSNHEQQHNLMRDGTSIVDGIGASKRLYEEQEDMISILP